MKIQIDKVTVEQALSALYYHTEQTRPIHQTYVAISALREAIDAALTAAHAEPVAWLDDNGHPHHISALQPLTTVKFGKWKPLYAAPQPQREPLSDEAIKDAWNSCKHSDGYPVTTAGFEFARAIEKLHGIGVAK